MPKTQKHSGFLSKRHNFRKICQRMKSVEARLFSSDNSLTQSIPKNSNVANLQRPDSAESFSSDQLKSNDNTG